MNTQKCIIITAMLFIVFLLPYAVGAQSYAQQVWDQLQEQYDSITSSGEYELLHYVIGKINDGESDYWTYDFYSDEEYIIVAACDYDCSDIDLSITDFDGETLWEDTDSDDLPYIKFSPSDSDEYDVEVHMYACSENPCYFGFGIFVRY